MSTVYALFHGRYNSIDKQLIGVYKTVEGAKVRAARVIEEDAIVGIGEYAEGPGISYSPTSGILFRGLRENPYSLWVVEMYLGE
jgi:hypothetical protein